MKIKVVTPDGIIVEKENVEGITVPTKAGVITVKDDHIPLVSLITAGGIDVDYENGESEYLSVSKGLIEVRRGSTVHILADTAERAEDIDIERAEEAKKKAEQLRSRAESDSSIDYTALAAKIQKELARVEVGKKWRKI